MAGGAPERQGSTLGLESKHVEPENRRGTGLGPAGPRGKKTIGGSKCSFSYACFATKKAGPGRQDFSKESQDQAWDVKSEYLGHEGDIHISEGHGFTPSILATSEGEKAEAALFFLLSKIKKNPTLYPGR